MPIRRSTATQLLVGASALALTIACAMPKAAHAANECGVEGTGADTITCTGASFPNGITYTGSDGLNLVLNNSAMTVTKGTSTGGVNLTGTTANDLTFTATSLTSVNGGTGTAVTVSNGGDGKAAVVLNAGSFTASAAQTVFASHASGAGDSVITMNGDSAANTTISGVVYTLDAEVSGTGTGNATVLMTGGAVQTGGNNASATMRAGISNAASAATASVSMTGGSMTGIGIGALATTNGSGLAQVTVNGGSITTGTGVAGTGGLFGAEALNSGSGNALVTLVSGSITSGNVFTASGLFASANSGSAMASMTNGTIAAKGSAGAGIYAFSTSGPATASISGGSITNTATNGYGLHAATGGTSTATATTILNGGTVSTTGNNGYGLYAQATNGQALVQMTGGSVTTSGSTAAALRAQSSNGLSVIEMTDGTVTANGVAQGVLATNNNSGTGTYNISITGGTVTGSGPGAVQGYSTAPGGIITIGAGATIIAKAGTSGIAIGTTGVNAAAATVTTAGTITGQINFQAGTANTLNIAGGSIAGNINGGGSDTLNFDLGTGGSFTYDAAYMASGMNNVVMKSGTANIAGTINTNMLSVNGGSMNLSGAMAPTGATTVAGGLLSVSGSLSTSAVTVSSGGTLNLTGTLTSANPVTVDGGLLSVTSALVAPSVAVQNNGVLAMNGTTAAAVTAASGGLLHGNGTMGATTIQSGGIIAPGNSIGTLHINGAYAANAGSIYNVELDPTSGASDLILVNGAATVSSGAKLNITANPAGTFPIGAHYTILTASGGVTGRYDDPVPFSQYLALQESQDANNIYLTMVQTADLASAAVTPNQQGVAQAVDALPDSDPVKTGVLNVPDETAARDAFDKLSAEAFASARGALVSGSLLVRDTAMDRLRDVCSADEMSNHPGCLDRDRPLVWAQGFGNWGRLGGNANAAAISHTTGGFLIGTDVPVYDWRVGVFGGYSRTDFHVDARSSWGASDNYHLGAYGGTNMEGIAVRLGASYSWNDLSTERLVAFGNFSDTLHASYNAGTAQVFGEVGQSFALDRLNLEPFANLSYLNLRTYAFREGGGDAALSSEAGTQEDTFTTIGLRPSTDFSLWSLPLRLKGMAGWRHTFGTVAPSATVAFDGGNAFTVTGAPIARDAGVVEAGISANITEAAAVNLTYGAQFGGTESNNGIRGTLAVAF